jgi:hypothetical protein
LQPCDLGAAWGVAWGTAWAVADGRRPEFRWGGPV